MGVKQVKQVKPLSVTPFINQRNCDIKVTAASDDDVHFSATIPSELPVHDLCNHIETFRNLEMGVPFSASGDKKLSWLRSQIIGHGAELESPFGKRKLIYADHTASGRNLYYIENFIIAHLLPFYGNTHTCDSYVGGRTTKMLKEAADYIKKCLGGKKDSAILFCGSGTTAAIKRLQEVMGIAIPSTLRDRVLKSLRTEERWVVFVGPYEHHSNLLSWRQSLAEVIEIGLDDNGLLDMESMRQQLETYKQTHRPILGSFSACSNVTGICSNTRAIARLLHRYGGFVCFDFAASGPYVEIDMKSGQIDGYDAIFLSPHKFLGGPGSPGILLMNKALYLLGSSAPSTCGGGTVNYVNGFREKDTLYMEDIEERENAGTPQIIQTVRAALAFWVKEYIGYDEIERREQIYIQRALDKLVPNPNIKILGNLSTKRLAVLSFIVHSTVHSSTINQKGECSEDTVQEQIRALNLCSETAGNTRGKPLHGAFVAKLLNDLFGIQARGGCACAGPYGHRLLDVEEAQSLEIRSAIDKGYVGLKPGWTRISFPYYMSNEEFEFILEAVEFVVTYGQRFLPLYMFSLRTGSWCLEEKKLQDALKDYEIDLPIYLLNKTVQAKKTDHTALREFSIGKLQKVGKGNRKDQYMQAAKCIANILPKFPSQRRLQEDIDPCTLLFRV